MTFYFRLVSLALRSHAPVRLLLVPLLALLFLASSSPLLFFTFCILIDAVCARVAHFLLNCSLPSLCVRPAFQHTHNIWRKCVPELIGRFNWNRASNKTANGQSSCLTNTPIEITFSKSIRRWSCISLFMHFPYFDQAPWQASLHCFHTSKYSIAHRIAKQRTVSWKKILERVSRSTNGLSQNELHRWSLPACIPSKPLGVRCECVMQLQFVCLHFVQMEQYWCWACDSRPSNRCYDPECPGITLMATFGHYLWLNAEEARTRRTITATTRTGQLTGYASIWISCQQMGRFSSCYSSRPCCCCCSCTFSGINGESLVAYGRKRF